MTEDDKPQQPPQTPPPLEYWHSDEPPGLHPVLLGLCLLAGGGIAAAVVCSTAVSVMSR